MTTSNWSQEVNEVYIDSILASATKAPGIEEKKLIIDALGLKLRRMPHDLSLRFFNYLNDQAKEHEDILMFSYMHTAPSYTNNGLMKESLDLRHYGLKIAKRLNHPISIFDYNQSLSSYYVNASVADSATYYVNEAEKIALAHPEKMGALVWQIYHRKGDIQVLLGNIEEQAYWYEEAWKAVDKYPDHPSRGFFLYVITDYFNQTKNPVKHAQYTELLVAYYKDRKVNTPDYHFPIESAILKEFTPEGIAHLKRVIKASDSLGNYNAYSMCALLLAEAYSEIGEPEAAIPIMERTVEKLYDAGYLIGDLSEHIVLRDLYVEVGDYENAYRVLMEQKAIEDSVRSDQVITNVADFEVKYNTERKERELEKKQASERLLFWILGSVFVLLAIITFFLIKNRKKNAQLAKQKKLLEATVDEKNVLLKETHHRVKNSFQMVSSLLYLQSENMEDKEAQLAIREAQNRVRSMVLIHQKLYSKDQLVGIDAKEYFQDLADDIFESHQLQPNDINYELKVDPMVLDVETVTPVGLILNELITNVLKHAYEGVTAPKELNIQFGQKGDQLELTVADNGIGMPSELKESSFGIKLMKALTKKLKATLAFEKNTPQGTLATLLVNRFTVLD